MSVVDKLYSGYGDRPTGNQPQMFSQGNAYLDKQWPKLDCDSLDEGRGAVAGRPVTESSA